MSQRKMGKELGVEPGAEMLAAIHEARAAGIHVALADRKITTTFRRAWRSMTIREKFRLVWHSMKALVGYDRALEEEQIDLEEIMKEDVITMMMEELRSFVPNATYALIDERDMYIARRIKDSSEAPAGRIRSIVPRAPLLRSLKDKEKETKVRTERGPKKIKKLPEPPRKVLGVVGAGHLKGIKKYLSEPERLPDISKLDAVPKKGISLLKLFGYLIPILFAAMFAYLIFFGEWGKVQNMFFWWFMINGICSAVGALIAKGHPISIGTAFVAAPFTSLNPTIGAGYVSGLVQAVMKKPTVKDLEDLPNALATFKGLWVNPVSRVLLVFVFSSLGSAAGTYVALGYIAGGKGLLIILIVSILYFISMQFQRPKKS